MRWLKKLLTGNQNTGGDSGKKVEIANAYGHLDSSPLLVDEHPDLGSIFDNSDPPVIQKLSDSNRDYWAAAPANARLMTAPIGYLQHPNPEVRIEVMSYVPLNPSARVDQLLIDLLAADSDPSVRREAAKTIWECERAVRCKYAVGSLRDEIQYGSERSLVGPSRARKALKLLVECAPDKDSKEELVSTINGVLRA